MTHYQKLEFFKKKNFQKFMNVYSEAECYCSDSQEIFCCCGKIATGLHEQNCMKFREKVEKETLRRLEAEE